MASPVEFTQESVRQFLLAQPDGRVTNHALVKHFKAWLTHPTEKTIARQRFKEYVNTLATIQQSESGEKFLVLKPKFFPKFDDDDDNNRSSSSPSLLDEVMAGYRPITTSSASTALKTSPPSDLGLPISSSAGSSRRSSYSSLSAAGYAVHNAPFKLPPSRPLPPDPPDLGLPLGRQHRSPVTENNAIMFSDASKPPLPHRVAHPQQPPPPPPLLEGTAATPPALPPRNNTRNRSPIIANEECDSGASLSQSYSASGDVDKKVDKNEGSPPQGSTSGSSEGSSERATPSDVSVKTASPVEERNEESIQDSAMGTESKEDEMESNVVVEPISVRERTKTFNRMSSESELNPERKTSGSKSGGFSKTHSSRKQSSSASVRRKNSTRGVSQANRMSASDADTASISTIDQTCKMWMVRSSQGDYHAMLKMLREDPRLAKHRDFTSGFTALHWAAKHGDLDMVKLLAGQHSADVNAKSHGGYTPLHLACQFGHQEVFDLLVKAYNADPQMRDNAGRTPRQYMMDAAAQQASAGVLTLSSDTFRQLKDRRRNRNRPVGRDQKGAGSGILRFGSLSVRVKKTTEAFNNYFSATSSNSGGNKLDQALMPPPPPRFGGLKKSRSKRGAELMVSNSGRVRRGSIKEEESDSEFGFDSQWTENK